MKERMGKMPKETNPIDPTKVMELKGLGHRLTIGAIALLGFVSLATAGQIGDNVSAVENQIRSAHPNGPEQLWEQLEGEQGLPLKRKESTALFAATGVLIFGGLVYVRRFSSEQNNQVKNMSSK
jgi:hypothetical protein